MTAVPALDRPSGTRRGPAPAGAVVVALVVAVVPLLTAVGTVAALRAGPDPGTASERDLPLGVVLLCLSGLLAGPAAAWTVRQDHPGAAVGLAVASAALALPVWAGWPWPPDVARACALAAGPLAVGGLAQVGLRWGNGAAGPALQVTLAAVVLATGVHLLGYDPFADPWCARTCATVPAVLDGVLSTAATIAVSAALVVIAASIAATALATRAATAPWLVRCAVGVSLVALAAAAFARAAEWSGTAGSGLVVVLAPVAVAVPAAAVAVVTARTARTRAAVDSLLADLRDPRDVSGTAAKRLRDVHFALPEEGRWVDRYGNEVTPPGKGDGVVVLPDAAGPAVRLLLAPGTDPDEVLIGLTPARRLALINARLTAVARARLGELRDSQRRAVARADAERTRIERDVHDGAQQRLISAMFQLALAQAQAAPHDRVTLARAQEEVQLALARLRRVTEGPFPAVLADEGLLAAVEDLALDANVPVQLEAHGDFRVDAGVGRAAYAVVASALAGLVYAAPETTARVVVSRVNGLLRVYVETRPAVSAEVDTTNVADRVGAIGGTYDRGHSGSTTVTTAVIPCES
jgi:signal transduction histidine kinase